jgi:hypothetical protein
MDGNSGVEVLEVLYPNLHPIWQTSKPVLEPDIGVTEL